MYLFERVPAANQSLLSKSPYEGACAELSAYGKLSCSPNTGSKQDLGKPNTVFLQPSLNQPGVQENGCPYATDMTQI